VVGRAQKTSDVGAMLQQIIYRSDWISGNDIVFIVEGTGVSLTDENAIRVADSYEGKPEYPPTLVYTFSFDASSVGTNDTKLPVNSLLFPNPFSNTLYIHIPSAEDQTVSVQITDIIGKVVFSQEIHINNGRLELYPDIQKKGVYLITVLTASNELILKQKVVKH